MRAANTPARADVDGLVRVHDAAFHVGNVEDAATFARGGGVRVWGALHKKSHLHKKSLRCTKRRRASRARRLVFISAYPRIGNLSPHTAHCTATSSMLLSSSSSGFSLSGSVSVCIVGATCQIHEAKQSHDSFHSSIPLVLGIGVGAQGLCTRLFALCGASVRPQRNPASSTPRSARLVNVWHAAHVGVRVRFDCARRYRFTRIVKGWLACGIAAVGPTVACFAQMGV